MDVRAERQRAVALIKGPAGTGKTRVVMYVVQK